MLAPCHNPRPHAAPQGSHVRHFRCLRHPDRLGDGRLRCLLQGGRARRLHAVPRGADPAVPPDAAGDQGRLLRALRRGPAPHRGEHLARAGLAAGALPFGLPARLGGPLASVQGDQHAARPVRQEVRGRTHLEYRRQAARAHAAALQGRLRPRGHGAAGPLLQAGSGPLQGGRAADRRQEGLGPRGVELLLRRRALPEGEDPGGLGQPEWRDPRRRGQEADGRGQDAARGREAARGRVRAVGLHADVVVATSRVYQTTCTLVRSGGEAFCIDSPVLPDELELLPALAQQSGFDVVGLLATHADWDHLLGRYAFPEAPLGCAETTAARLVNEPGVGERELEIQPADGHTVDGMAVWIPWARVLVCGDYLSPVEIPMLHTKGAVPAYLATLSRLEPLVQQADHVVPGHGAPIDGARAAAILREDRAYVEALLERGKAAKLPL